MIVDFDNYSTEKDISIKITLSDDFIYENKIIQKRWNTHHLKRN